VSEPVWIDKNALLLLHRMGLSRFGGADGIRDEGLLDSALARPLNLYAYEPDSDIVALAASYAFGLVRNHAFVDGNKRAGFLACGLFLELNGLSLRADQADATSAVLALAEGSIGEQEFAAWLRQNVEPAVAS
jgi:death-on-curing protein